MTDKSNEDNYLFEEINMGQVQPSEEELPPNYLDTVRAQVNSTKRAETVHERQGSEDIDTEKPPSDSTKRQPTLKSIRSINGEDIRYLQERGVFHMVNVWGYNSVRHANYEAKTHLDRYGLWGRLLQSYTDPIMRPLAKLQTFEATEIYDFDINIFKKRVYMGPDSTYASYPDLHALLMHEILLPFMRTSGVKKGLKAYQTYCKKQKGAKYRTLVKAVDALFYLANGNYEKAAEAERKKK